MALSDAFVRDDGTPDEAGVDSPWPAWVAPSKTCNACDEDPILDWFDLYGRQRGIVPDNERPGYDERTDFLPFLLERGRAFEQAVVEHLARRYRVETVRMDAADARRRSSVEATWDAMRRGAEIIAQGVLWNPEAHVYGSPDLLVRSDVLRELFPGDLSEEEACFASPDCPIGSRHYRVVEIKFTTLNLLKAGQAATEHLPYMVQAYLYNEALGRMQGLTPQAAFLLGRRWKTPKARGNSAMERLASVRADREFRDGTLRDVARDACGWVRRVQVEGASWQVLPRPSVAELWPNLRAHDDQPWHLAKRELGNELRDLTILPRVTPERRAQALATGIWQWTDSRCSAASLGVSAPASAAILNAVIDANQSPADGPVVFPERITVNEERWRASANPEFYVDFETVSDLDDDFSRFPEASGQPLIFMIGCGHFCDTAGVREWKFRTFAANSLCRAEELRIIEDWFQHLQDVSASAASSLEKGRLFHWSPAETSTLTDAYNAAHIRHGEPLWPALPWCDLLSEVVRAEPVTVRGAFGFGLKAIAKALHQHGLIANTWDDGPTDGLGAMVGAWWCHRQAAAVGCSMTDLDLMQEIARYNETDCRAMADVLQFFRKSR